MTGPGMCGTGFRSTNIGARRQYAGGPTVVSIDGVEHRLQCGQVAVIEIRNGCSQLVEIRGHCAPRRCCCCCECSS